MLHYNLTNLDVQCTNILTTMLKPKHTRLIEPWLIDATEGMKKKLVSIGEILNATTPIEPSLPLAPNMRGHMERRESAGASLDRLQMENIAILDAIEKNKMSKVRDIVRWNESNNEKLRKMKHYVGKRICTVDEANRFFVLQKEKFQKQKFAQLLNPRSIERLSHYQIYSQDRAGLNNVTECLHSLYLYSERLPTYRDLIDEMRRERQYEAGMGKDTQVKSWERNWEDAKRKIQMTNAMRRHLYNPMDKEQLRRRNNPVVHDFIAEEIQRDRLEMYRQKKEQQQRSNINFPYKNISYVSTNQLDYSDKSVPLCRSPKIPSMYPGYSAVNF